MTIQQAIERAKEMRKGREAAFEKAPPGELGHPGQPAPPPARRAAGRSAAAAALAVDATAIPVPTLTFPFVAPDPVICERNRALVNVEINPSSAAAYDAYRIMRTQLRTKAGQHGWHQFAVTSAGPGEGKSTTALNLALSLAREKRQNVVLLDLDLRSPSIAGYLGVTPPTEIGQVLSGVANASDLLFSIGVEQLAIGAGTRRFENSSELLSGASLDALLAQINSLDPAALMIIDLPPILATADALVMAPKVSATILVVSEGKTRRDELDRAGEMLQGIEIAGVVLNESKQSSTSYYGY